LVKINIEKDEDFEGYVMAKVSVRVIDAYVYHFEEKKVKFLLLKRAKTKIYEHLWQGVAGKIENNEQAWETAKRELKEETGLNPVHMFVADHISRFYEAHTDTVNLVPVFGIEVNNKNVKLSKEHCEYLWVDFETAIKMLVWNGQKEGVAVVYNMLNSNDNRMRWSEISL
tara:strand:- start:1412 stop:1921 length:510 start_codon:yes stop_codon:yes gene_type:complete